MTKAEAFKIGYCKKCAAWDTKRYIPMCGVADLDGVNCKLPAEAIERWKGEHGLAGERKRSPKGAFGCEEWMKKKKGPYDPTRYKKGGV